MAIGYITFGLILEKLAPLGGRILGLFVANMGLGTLKLSEKFVLVFSARQIFRFVKMNSSSNKVKVHLGGFIHPLSHCAMAGAILLIPTSSRWQIKVYSWEMNGLPIKKNVWHWGLLKAIQKSKKLKNNWKKNIKKWQFIFELSSACAVFTSIFSLQYDFSLLNFYV